jgi:adenylosuccinate lyase
MEGMLHDHEVNGANSMMTDTALHQASILSGDLLVRLKVILEGLELDEARMRANLELSGGMITSEAVMLSLGEIIGRQRAHEVVYEAAQTVVREGKTFAEVLASDPRVTAHLSEEALQDLLDPMPKTGLSRDMARKGSKRARRAAARLSNN